MRLPYLDVLQALKAKGIDALYYASSVEGASKLLRSGSFMLAGADTYVDTVDAHALAGEPNSQGPVLFVLDMDLIAQSFTGSVWISKLAPANWEGKTESEKWFRSLEDIVENFSADDPEQMVVFRDIDEPMPFKNSLRKIVLDDPRQETAQGVQFYHVAAPALRRAMFEIRLDVPLEKRNCDTNCTCLEKYKTGPAQLAKIFDILSLDSNAPAGRR